MKYYLLGIGGVSMSALATFLKESGHQVSGYDQKESVATKNLLAQGFSIDYEFNYARIDQSDVVVYSSAIKKDHPLFDYALKTNKKLLCRGEVLGIISNAYEKVIAISGAHGKTTTTAMVYEVLKTAGKNPTLHLGGFRAEDQKNCVLGEKEFFVTEACEYYDNFLYLHPYIGVVLNVEKEHMDYFKTFERQLQSFDKFKSQSRFVIDNVDELSAKNIRHNKKGGLVFDIFEKNKKILHLNLKICEEINSQNCLYAYKICKFLGIEDCLIKQGLENFNGVNLRFQKVLCKTFDNVVLDYAHHPTEVSKAIASAKKIYKNHKLVVVFQPHTYSRTKTLLNEFLQVFKDVETPVLYKTYSARENLEDGISAQKFTEILKKYNKNAVYCENFEDLTAFLKGFSKKQTILLFVGAGDLPEILHKNNFIS